MSTYDHTGSPMHGWPLTRRETGLLEAVCPDGIGHPIPESVSHMGNEVWGVHGCDGCCAGTESAECRCLRCKAERTEQDT